VTHSPWTELRVVITHRIGAVRGLVPGAMSRTIVEESYLMEGSVEMMKMRLLKKMQIIMIVEIS
jgi:hypothetical protein